MTTPLMHEPTDPPDPVAILVSRSKFERLATTLGAVVEISPAAYFVEFNGRTYYTPRGAL